MRKLMRENGREIGEILRFTWPVFMLCTTVSLSSSTVLLYLLLQNYFCLLAHITVFLTQFS